MERWQERINAMADRSPEYMEQLRRRAEGGDLIAEHILKEVGLGQALPKRISEQDEADYRRVLEPSAEILTATANGNAQAREIVRLATDRTPDSGGWRRRLNGTVGVFVSPSPADTPREGRDEREG